MRRNILISGFMIVILLAALVNSDQCDDNEGGDCKSSETTNAIRIVAQQSSEGQQVQSQCTGGEICNVNIRGKPREGSMQCPAGGEGWCLVNQQSKAGQVCGNNGQYRYEAWMQSNVPNAPYGTLTHKYNYCSDEVPPKSCQRIDDTGPDCTMKLPGDDSDYTGNKRCIYTGGRVVEGLCTVIEVSKAGQACGDNGKYEFKSRAAYAGAIHSWNYCVEGGAGKKEEEDGSPEEIEEPNCPSRHCDTDYNCRNGYGGTDANGRCSEEGKVCCKDNKQCSGFSGYECLAANGCSNTERKTGYCPAGEWCCPSGKSACPSGDNSDATTCLCGGIAYGTGWCCKGIYVASATSEDGCYQACTNILKQGCMCGSQVVPDGKWCCDRIISDNECEAEIPRCINEVKESECMCGNTPTPEGKYCCSGKIDDNPCPAETKICKILPPKGLPSEVKMEIEGGNPVEIEGASKTIKIKWTIPEKPPFTTEKVISLGDCGLEISAYIPSSDTAYS